MANIFNNFFCTIGDEISTEEPTNHIKPQQIKVNDKSIYLFATHEEEIINVINKLKNNSAMGRTDKINCTTLKSIAKEIGPVLAYLINKSFKEDIFPEALKEAVIKPIYKAGNHADINNYRPIAILNIISKIYEKIMKKRLIEFINKNNILTNCQYGFRKGCSTTQAVIDCVHQIEQEKKLGNIPIGILLDFKKAFDSIDHDILLNKLHRIGVRGNVYKWFESYIKNRNNYTTINTEISEKHKQPFGLGQGTVISPILFLIYINDLQHQTGETVRFFADDTLIIASGKKQR